MTRYLLIFFLLTSCATNEKSYWEGAASPSKGVASSIGFYSAGCLAGARSLPYNSEGIVVMRPSRKRYYGHPEMIDYLLSLGKKVRASLKKDILLGDISMPQGGPMPFGHNSHQTGLDVDIWFDFHHSEENFYYSDLENMPARNYVTKKLELKGWNSDHEKLLEIVANDERVERIFVSAAIKKYFCAKNVQQSWHKKLRSWFGHKDHLHIRLACPENSGECKSQKPVLDNGCSEGLEWWFSDEAFDMAKTPSFKKKVKLPIQCEMMSN